MPDTALSALQKLNQYKKNPNIKIIIIFANDRTETQRG